MKIREIIILKILGIGATILYGWSLLWISVMYLYGAMYYPINESVLKRYIPFEFIVIALSVLIMGFVIVKLKGRTFLKVLGQDILIIIFSLPFFATLLSILKIGLDDTKYEKTVYAVIVVLTLLTVNINDIIKQRSASR